MASPIDTDDWALHAFLQWKPKRTPRCAPCSYCNGHKTVGGGFKDLDGPRECPECFGSGVGKTIDPLGEHPDIPAGLTEHMRKAWVDFFAEKDHPNCAADLQSPRVTGREVLK